MQAPKKKPLPSLKPGAPGINGFNYRPRYGVIVICKDEAHHKTVYETLKAQGYKCRVVRT